MNCLDLFNKSFEKIKKSGFEYSVDAENKNRNIEYYYSILNETTGISFSEDIKDFYKSNSVSRVIWKDLNRKLYGCYDLIPIQDIISLHDDMVDIADSAIEYAQTEEEKNNISRLNIISRLYPIFDFSTGNKLCIDSSTGQIVFYDYTVNELGNDDINGLVIAKSFDDLMEKWSKILFLENFWWLTEYNRCVNADGIDMSNYYINQFIFNLNKIV